MRDIAGIAVEAYSVDLVLVSIAEVRTWTAPDAETDDFAEIAYVPRPLHRVKPPSSTSLAHVRHSRLREYGERTAAAIALIPLLRRLRDERSVAYVHFFDNLGPGAGLLARVLGIRSGVTLLGSAGSAGSKQTRAFWRASTCGIQDVVAGSQALRRELEAAAVPVRAVIPWGPKRRPATAPTVPVGSRRVVAWSGPLGNSGPREALISARAMALARDQIPALRACLWSKPEYAAQYRPIAEEFRLTFEVPGQLFLQRLDDVRILVSPVAHAHEIVRPDLTWLEAIQSGVRVVTTPCKGLDQSLVRTRSVIVAEESSPQAVAAAIACAWTDSGQLTTDLWTAEDAARQYVQLWEGGQ